MGKCNPAIAPTTEKRVPRRRRKGSSDTPSPNALRERVRAQNMKRAYLNLQKTLPQVPPDTKLPRLNILLLAIDYISHLRDVLHNDSPEEEHFPQSPEEKCGMFRPFIEVRANIRIHVRLSWTLILFRSCIQLNCAHSNNLWMDRRHTKAYFKEIISLTILKWSAKLQSQQSCLYCSTSQKFV